ncbi:MAG TPA: TolC family protein, partial [Gammaproteobacteria bacterium]|nr:TolC family protein [Gammaproteobacteria bacterium]
LKEDAPEPISLSISAIPLEDALIEKALHYHLAPLLEELTHAKEDERRLRDNFLWDIRLKGSWSIDKQRYFWMEDILNQEVYVKSRGSNHRYLGLFMTIPLSKDYSTHIALYQNKVIQEKKHLDLKHKELMLKQEIHNLFQQFQQWQNQQSIVEKAFSFAQHMLRIEEEKYLAGRSSLLDLQRMQEIEMQSALDKISLQATLLLARVELDYCIGLLPNTWREYVV